MTDLSNTEIAHVSLADIENAIGFRYDTAAERCCWVMTVMTGLVAWS